MASLDFDLEKGQFLKFYDSSRPLLESARKTYTRIISSLIRQSDIGEVTKIEGRVKDKEECIKKFQRKYQSKLEGNEQPYAIKDYITDLIGIRVVCLYEDQIPMVAEAMKQRFEIIDVTDKISAVESTEDLFGYKGLHMDLVLNDQMSSLPKYKTLADYPFEVQIRSLIQDTWSVLDHKIKYKKSIPNELKRRINVLSALFELADREFKEIRNATTELIQQATVAPVREPQDENHKAANQSRATSSDEKTVNAFNFLRVAGHFFRDFEFEDYKVDGFVQSILKLDGGFQKSDLHECLNENLKTVREYRESYLAENPDSTFSPYTSIRHCLYLYNRETFSRILSKGPKDRFEDWLKAARRTSL